MGSRMVRGLITAGAVGALVWAVVLGGGGAATATQGQAVIAGEINDATSQTRVTNTTFGGSAFYADSHDGTGVLAISVQGANSPTNVGLLGLAGAGSVTEGASWPGDGVHGHGSVNGISGVTANSAAAGVYGTNSGQGNGVWGRVINAASGVYGETAGTGNGVLGFAPSATGVKGQTTSGTGVLATATGSGTALSVSGKAQFSRSGVATIAYPAKSAVISGVPVTSRSIALATIQKFLAGVYVVAAVPNLSGSSNSFTIYLNKAPGSSTAPKSVVVGWQVIERP